MWAYTTPTSERRATSDRSMCVCDSAVFNAALSFVENFCMAKFLHACMQNVSVKSIEEGPESGRNVWIPLNQSLASVQCSFPNFSSPLCVVE